MLKVSAVNTWFCDEILNRFHTIEIAFLMPPLSLVASRNLLIRRGCIAISRNAISSIFESPERDARFVAPRFNVGLGCDF